MISEHRDSPRLAPALAMREELQLRRIAPALAAAVFAIAYVIISPPSLDLAAHLLRTKLFSVEGFGIWNNWWYGGHNVPGYSILFPPFAALLTPQIVAAISVIGTAALFEPLARRHFGETAWLGALWFGAGTAINLYTGRLTFAFGLLPAVGMALALQRRRPVLASVLAALSALGSPVAALFAALAAGAYAVGSYLQERNLRAAIPGVAATIAALLPVLLLAIVFPEGGSEPFTFATLWPILLISVVALVAIPGREWTLRAGVVLYIAGCLLSYVIITPAGSNVARLGPLVAGPFAALLWYRRRLRWLALVALPLLYFQWQAPIRDVRTSAGDPSVSAAYYEPLLDFLYSRSGPPFRVEIPFTKFHWEAYQVAPAFPLARGWERQLDIKYNHLFYDGSLNASTYQQWLHQLAVRYVAVPDASLDFSAVREVALIDHGLPYLRLVYRTRHWRVYAVANATPLVSGAATLTALGPNSVTVNARHAGTVLVRVRFSPYWMLGQGSGCVAPAGQFTKLELTRPGPAKLVISFSLVRIGADSPRCT